MSRESHLQAILTTRLRVRDLRDQVEGLRQGQTDLLATCQWAVGGTDVAVEPAARVLEGAQLIDPALAGVVRQLQAMDGDLDEYVRRI